MCDEYFSLHRHYFANPDGEDVKKWIVKHISKFYNNPTVNESWIVVLLRQFWVSTGKEKAMMQKVFLSTLTCFRNSQRWECSKMSYKPGAQISRWSNGEWVRDRLFSKISLVVCGKKRDFKKRRRENEIEWKRKYR